MLAAKQLLSIVVVSAFFTVASAQAHARCSRNGTVQSGDTCNIFSAREGVSTFQLFHANPVINTLCYNLYPDENLCVGLMGEDCTKVAKVGDKDSCASIATAANIPESTLIMNNRNLDTDCANIRQGMVLCVDSTTINYDYGRT